MSGDNKTLGRFELVGIPAAPRGVPQIEVTFDIDANGIVHVSAKDLGTGKEQSIQITASSGLSEDEIEKMVRDAEEHAADDKARKESAESKNKLDSALYQTESSLKEHKDKLSAEDVGLIERAIEGAKKVLEDQAAGKEQFDAAAEELNQASHKLAEVIYKSSSENNQQQEQEQQQQATGTDGPEDVVDADFEEVNNS